MWRALEQRMTEKPPGGQLLRVLFWVVFGVVSPTWSCLSRLYEPLPTELSTTPSLRGIRAFFELELISLSSQWLRPSILEGFYGLIMHMHIVESHPCAFTSNAFHQHASWPRQGQPRCWNWPGAKWHLHAPRSCMKHASSFKVGFHSNKGVKVSAP